jgi:hypothetical protein
MDKYYFCSAIIRHEARTGFGTISIGLKLKQIPSYLELQHTFFAGFKKDHPNIRITLAGVQVMSVTALTEEEARRFGGPFKFQD